MSKQVVLGHVDLPEGVLIVLDPGLARFWRHDGDPGSPRGGDPKEWDLELVGPDAVAAGQAYDRQWDPRFLYDIADVDRASEHFAAFAREHGFDARAQRLNERVPHVARTHAALAHGQGLGVVPYNGLWAACVGGLPSDRTLQVVAEPMPRGEFAGRWRWIDIVVDAGARAVRSDSVQGVMVDHGQLLFAGLRPLGSFRMWESLDGLADFVFWGADAEALAREVGAAKLNECDFGWRDLAIETIGEHAQNVQQRIDREKLRAGGDYRPHCNLERLNAQVRADELGFGQLVLGGARMTGGDNRWGDGVFTVSRQLDGKGRLVRVRVELGSEERQAVMRRVQLPGKLAMVTRAVHDNGEPIRFSERGEPRNDRDSGWLYMAGIEDDEHMDDADNFVIVPMRALLERFPALKDTLGAPVGAALPARRRALRRASRVIGHAAALHPGFDFSAPYSVPPAPT